jgi:hypothetical protein
MVRHEAAEALGSIAGIASKTKSYGIMRPLLQSIYTALTLLCSVNYVYKLKREMQAYCIVYGIHEWIAIV